MLKNIGPVKSLSDSYCKTLANVVIRYSIPISTKRAKCTLPKRGIEWACYHIPIFPSLEVAKIGHIMTKAGCFLPVF